MTALGLAALLVLSWVVAGVFAHLLGDLGWLLRLWDDQLPDPMPDDWCDRTVQRGSR